MLQSTVFNVVCLCIFNGMFMIAGVFFNSVVIISLWRSSSLRNKLCYFIIFALSCVDLAVVVITHPAQILSTIFTLGQLDEICEVIRINVNFILHGSSMHALFILNVERFLAVTYPFFHRKSVTKSRLMFTFVILMLLLFSLLAVSNLVQLKTLANLLAIVYLSVFFFLFIYLNYKLLIVVTSKRENGIDRDAMSIDYKRKKLMLHNLKDISTCFAVVFCLFVCSCPQIVYSALRLTSKTSFHDRKVLIFHLWAGTFVSMNSTFNCFIFFWRNSFLRREGMKILKCFQF